MPHYLIIGRGRVAKHMHHYLHQLGLTVTTWHRQSDTPLAEALVPASHVLLLIHDQAIAPFYQCHQALLQHRNCLHFSGACHIPNISCAHPLMTFTTELYALTEYQQIPFVLFDAAHSLSKLLPGLPNPWHFCPAEQKSRYHAWCSLLCNLTTLNWQINATRLQEHCAIPQDHLRPILQRTQKNFFNNPHTALTGPLTRNDQATIDTHLQTLQGDPLHDLYQAYIHLYRQEQPTGALE